MKILKLGVDPRPPVESPWWVGTIVDCQKCNTQFQLEHDDSVYRDIDRDTGQVRCIKKSCPTCNEGCTVQRPIAQTSLNKYHENRHDAHASKSIDTVETAVLG